MQQINIATVKASKATDRKALAILAYDNACSDPAGANWRAVSDILRLAIPATKAKPAEIPADPSRPAWADYDIPENATRKLGKSPIIVVAFADGETVRAPAVSLPGKPVNIGRGLRIAFAYYRARMAARHAGEMAAWSGCVNVPALVSVACESDGFEYDAAECNAQTATFRTGEFDPAALAAEAVARGLPTSADDGSLTVAEFVRASYIAARSRLRLAGGVDADEAAKLAGLLEDADARAAGGLWLVINKRRSEIKRAAYLAMHEEERAADDAWHTSRQAIIDAAQKDRDDSDLIAWLEERYQIRATIVDDIMTRRDPDGTPRRERGERLAFAVMTFWPDLADTELGAEEPADAPATSPPVAPSFKPAARFLASSRLTLVSSNPPVAPSRGAACILRIVA